MRCVLEAADRQDASKLTAASLGAPKRIADGKDRTNYENNKEKDMEKGVAAIIMQVLSDQRDSRICLSGSGEDIGVGKL